MDAAREFETGAVSAVSPPAVGVFTGAGDRLTGADDTFLALVGYDRASFDRAAPTLAELAPSLTWTGPRGILARAAASGDSSPPIATQLVRRDGSPIPILVAVSLRADTGSWDAGAWDTASWEAGAVDLDRRSPVTDASADPHADTPERRLLGALVDERRRILAMLDSTPVLVWSIDRELRVLGSNRAFQRAQSARTGRSLRPGDPVVDPVFVVDRAADWEGWYRRVLAGEQFEVRLRTDDGRVVDLVFTPLLDAAGDAVGATVTGSDVTERDRAMSALAHREALQRIAAQLGRVGGWMIELPSREVSLTDELAASLRLETAGPYQLDESVSWYPPGDRDRIRAAIDRCAEEGAPFELEVQLVSPGRTPVWARVVGEAHRDADGTIIAVHGALVDITEHKDLENRLRDQGGILDGATDAILVRDLDGCITAWNRAAEDLYGWTADEAIGRHIADLVDGGDLDKFHEMNEHLWMHGEFSGRIDNVDRDGRSRPIDLHVNVIRDPDGNPTKVFSIASDASERVRLEQQLDQAQRLDAIGQLTGGIAHDFNNFLTVIIGGCELLAESLGDDEDAASINAMVLAAAEQGAQLTARLLAFARRQTLQPQELDPVAVIDGLVRLLRRSIPESVALAVADRPDRVWPVAVDPGQFESALVNVALNARDAMPDGGTLTFGVRDVDVDDEVPDLRPGEYVEITVTDTGEGMASDVRDHAFDPFFTTKPVGRGTGLGLSMAYGFAKQSGGHVELTSSPGRGTTVRFLLPRSADGAGASRSSPSGHTAVPGGDEHVLVVEDEPMVRRHAVSVLRSLGYRVVEAVEGADALALLDLHPDIDVVFTDVVMPGGMTGVELAQHVRLLRPTVRILLTSGYTESALATPSGSEHPIVTKPYRRHELAIALRAVLDADLTDPDLTDPDLTDPT